MYWPYYFARRISYYPYPQPSFDPYNVELPTIVSPQQKINRCRRKCMSMGYYPGTLEWNYCMHGCSVLLGSLLNDPTFLGDMLNQ